MWLCRNSPVLKAEVVLLNWLATLLPESEQAFFHLGNSEKHQQLHYDYLRTTVLPQRGYISNESLNNPIDL